MAPRSASSLSSSQSGTLRDKKKRRETIDVQWHVPGTAKV